MYHDCHNNFYEKYLPKPFPKIEGRSENEFDDMSFFINRLHAEINICKAAYEDSKKNEEGQAVMEEVYFVQKYCIDEPKPYPYVNFVNGTNW